MTTNEVLDLLSDRGLAVVLANDGSPRLRGPKEEMTPALLAVLKLHREEIISRLRPAPPPQDAEPVRPKVVPPPDRRLFCQDEHARICGPEHCYLWTWEGASQWYYATEDPPPGWIGNGQNE